MSHCIGCLTPTPPPLVTDERPRWACAACWGRVVAAHRAYEARPQPCGAAERERLLAASVAAIEALRLLTDKDWVLDRVELTDTARKFGAKAMAYAYRLVGWNLCNASPFDWALDARWKDNARYDTRFLSTTGLAQLGRAVVDPQGRHVLVVAVGHDATGPYVETQLGGDYAATVRLPPSAVREVSP